MVDNGLQAIVCIGETLTEREANQTMDICIRQLKPVVEAVAVNQWSHIVIAYEPVWAIGTGKVATKEQAQEVHAALRAWLATNVNADVANAVRIVYGGSVNVSIFFFLTVEEEKWMVFTGFCGYNKMVYLQPFYFFSILCSLFFLPAL